MAISCEEEDQRLGGLVKEALAEVLGVLRKYHHQESGFWVVE